MRRYSALTTTAALAALLAVLTQAPPARAQGAAALSGQVTSAEEGAMEGVIVNAKKDGSNITVSVVTNEQGLARDTNMRHMFVDNTTSPVTFWFGSNHGASIVKVEPRD
jgi:hypothetical protein